MFKVKSERCRVLSCTQCDASLHLAYLDPPTSLPSHPISFRLGDRNSVMRYHTGLCSWIWIGNISDWPITNHYFRQMSRRSTKTMPKIGVLRVELGTHRTDQSQTIILNKWVDVAPKQCQRLASWGFDARNVSVQTEGSNSASWRNLIRHRIFSEINSVKRCAKGNLETELRCKRSRGSSVDWATVWNVQFSEPGSGRKMFPLQKLPDRLSCSFEGCEAHNWLPSSAEVQNGRSHALTPPRLYDLMDCKGKVIPLQARCSPEGG